jgi:hypothetical protein
MKLMRSPAWIVLVAAAAAAPALGADPTGPVQSAALSDQNLGWLERQGQSDHWGRDPFAAPRRPAPSESSRVDLPQFAPDAIDLHLSAIIYGEGRGLAIINNSILRKGDRVGDKEIVDILRDRVVLRDAAGEQELRVDAFTR